MDSGIYAIRNKETNKFYIGQSVNIDKRIKRHFRELRNGIHYNLNLQRSFDLYGRDSFEELILEYCKKEDLPLAEQKWIEFHKREQLYNIIFDVQLVSGSFLGKKHTLESRSKMSKSKKGKYKGKDNPNFGNRNPLETRIRMSIGLSGKLTAENILQIKDMLLAGERHADIAKKFEISRTVVTRISNGTRWTNITGGPVIPVTYNSEGKRQFSKAHRDKIGQGRKGKLHTEETKRKMSEARRKTNEAKGETNAGFDGCWDV